MSVWSYAGKRVVIAGCATGMGAACAEELVRLGAEVHAADVKPTPVSVRSFTPVDFRDPDSMSRAADSIGGEIDALFNCVGLPQTFPAIDVVKVNFLGTRYWTRQWVPRLRPGSGIAVISSTAGMGYRERLALHRELADLHGWQESVAWLEAHQEILGDGYGFSKEAINVWVQQQCVALAGKNIRINAILPGPTDTPMMADFERVAGASRIDVFTAPTFRRARPEEQAYPLIFLNSAAASFISGVCLAVDGGFSGGVGVGSIDLAALRAKAAAGT